MRPFDLLLRKLWPETLRGHQRAPGEFGPPQRGVNQGFQDRRKVKAGTFPRPVKLGPRITAWKAEDIRALIRDGVR